MLYLVMENFEEEFGKLCSEQGLDVVLDKIKNIKCTKHGNRCFPKGTQYEEYRRNPITNLNELVVITVSINLNGCDTLKELVAEQMGICQG